MVDRRLAWLRWRGDSDGGGGDGVGGGGDGCGSEGGGDGGIGDRALFKISPLCCLFAGIS